MITITSQPAVLPSNRIEFTDTLYMGRMCDAVVTTARIIVDDQALPFSLPFGHRSSRGTQLVRFDTLRQQYPEYADFQHVFIQASETEYVWFNAEDGYPLYPVESIH
jgi:hypothetical protein